MTKSIQDKLEEVVDEVVHAPIIEKKKRVKKVIEAGESHALDYVESIISDDNLYPTPVTARHKGYPMINK